MKKHHMAVAVLALLVLALVAGGCKKDETTNPVNPGGGGGILGQATCQIDGAAKTFIGLALVDTSSDVPGGMYFGGFSASGADTIVIEMFIGTVNPANGSSYTLSTNNYGGLGYISAGTQYLTNATSTGTLGVTTNGSSSIAGTFSFTARQVDGTGTKSVTGGSYNFPKQIGAAQDGPRMMREMFRLPAGR